VTAVARGELTVVDLKRDDNARCADLINRYADLGLGLVDASIVAVAERLGVTLLATINHRDFRVVQPRHAASFELIP
jgi:predicted nucleic acid-binding protein